MEYHFLTLPTQETQFRGDFISENLDNATALIWNGWGMVFVQIICAKVSLTMQILHDTTSYTKVSSSDWVSIHAHAVKRCVIVKIYQFHIADSRNISNDQVLSENFNKLYLFFLYWSNFTLGYEILTDMVWVMMTSFNQKWEVSVSFLLISVEIPTTKMKFIHLVIQR